MNLMASENHSDLSADQEACQHPKQDGCHNPDGIHVAMRIDGPAR